MPPATKNGQQTNQLPVAHCVHFNKKKNSLENIFQTGFRFGKKKFEYEGAFR